MDSVIRRHIAQYCEKKGYGTSDDDILEVLLGAKWLSAGLVESHRWWDIRLYVVDIDGMLIGFEYAHSTGDESAVELGWRFDDSHVWVVMPVEKTVIVYERVVKGGHNAE